MQQLSRLAYDEQWVQHLEYALWYATIHGPMDYGRHSLDNEDIARLKALSAACGGWVYYREGSGATFVVTREWQDIFSCNFELVSLG